MKLWLASGVTAGLALGIFAFAHRPGIPETSVQPFQVDATEVDGRVRLTWNPELPQIKAATGGTLEVRDGDKSESYPIEGKMLRRGSLDYVRDSKDVLLSVRLLENRKPGSQSVIRVIAPVIAVVPPTPPKLAHRPARSEPSKKVTKARKPVKKPRRSSFAPRR